MGSGWVKVYFLISVLKVYVSVVKHSVSVLKMLGATAFFTQEEKA
jgi:hypothetical protein